MITEYSFKLKRRLSELEIRLLWAEALPKLSSLVERYGENGSGATADAQTEEFAHLDKSHSLSE
jgi:hypothetical protein